MKEHNVKSGFATRGYAPLKPESIGPLTPFFKEWTSSLIKRIQIEDNFFKGNCP